MIGSEYVPVEANSVNALAEGGGSMPEDLPGFNIPGAYINWDRDTGIIYRGWTHVLKIPNNPFTINDITDEDGIKQIINNEGSLNSIFNYWGAHLTAAQIGQFLIDLEKYYGVYKPSTGQDEGCIGDQMV